MKILIDPVYTNRPRICSTSYLFWQLIEELIEWRDDLFFYVLYPPNKMEEDDWKFMSRFPDRVTLLPLPQATIDRVSEEFMMRNQLRFYLNPWCNHTWDVDVVMSCRMPVIKNFRTHSSRPLGKTLISNRMYIGMEDMPILPFRDTVAWSGFLYPDALVSYGLVDAILMNNQWTKKYLVPVLREVFSPAWQKKVLNNIHEVLPITLQRLDIKSPATRYHDGQDFELAFVGRMTSTRNFGGVTELFRKQFSYPIGPNRNKIKFRISTNSETMGGSDPGEIDFLDIQLNDRPKFHEFLKGAHLAVNLTSVEDFSLSTYETLRAGVPILVYKEPWNEFLGPTYPLRAENQVEAFAMISAYAANYEREYAKFVEWEQTHWKAYVEGPLNITTTEVVRSLIQTWMDRRDKLVEESGAGGTYKEQILAIKEKPDGTIDLTEHLKQTGKMFDAVDEPFSLALGRVPSTLMLKLMAQQLGFRDTNKVGVMKRVQSVAPLDKCPSVP